MWGKSATSSVAELTIQETTLCSQHPANVLGRYADRSLHWKTTFARDDVQQKLDANIHRRATLLDKPVGDPIVVAAP